MLSAELLIKCGYLNFIKNAFPNEAAAVLWHATWYTQHATCYIINVNIFIRLPSPATDCNCNAACFGNNMQILITVSAVFALKIANFNNHCVCRCSYVCARGVCRICALFIICKFHAQNIDDEIWGLITSIDRLIVLAHVISMAFITASQLKSNLYICYIYYIHAHRIEYLHTFV